MVMDEEIKNILKNATHPEINYSLIALGMIGEISMNNTNITIVLKLPMVKIPIKDQLVSLIVNTITEKKPGFSVDVKIGLMNDEERIKFFELAKQGWTGAI
jgi:metal-sulfur cluster biosynthetic enzyme